MIRSIKSWWYWNVTSKYDGPDVVMFVFFPLLVVMMLVLGYEAMEEKKQYAAVCESKGGVLVSTHKSYICLDAKVIIQ